MDIHGSRGASTLKRASSRARDSTLLSSQAFSGSPGGSDILGKLTSMLRGHNSYSELVDDCCFDDPRYSNSGAPTRPLTPASPLLTWDLDSPHTIGRVRSNTTSTVARHSSASSTIRRQSLSPRRRHHDTILVTEFKFLHKSFAPPFPLAASQAEDGPPAPLSPFRASVDDVLFDNNDDDDAESDNNISIDPGNLRDSVRHLVRHIQRHDSGECTAMLECSDVTPPDLDLDDDQICLLGSSSADRMSSEAFPGLDDDTFEDLSTPERSSDKEESLPMDSRRPSIAAHSNQRADDDDEVQTFDDDDIPVLTTSVRNLVLNLRRDCARQSLHPVDLIGVPTTHHHHHHHHLHHHPHAQNQPRASQPSIRRRRNHSHPLDSPSRGMVPPPPPFAAVAPRDTKPLHFSRLMSSVAGGLRRLSIHKSRAPAGPAATRFSTFSGHPSHNSSPGAPPHVAASPDIDGARWKIIELAFRFGGPHRYYLVQAVNMFYPLTKYGRRGGPHSTRLVCHPYGTLQWEHKRGGFSAPMDLALASHVVDGRETPVFHKCDGHGGGYGTSYNARSCSLSVVFGHRTLDLETQSADHRDWLGSALRTLMQYAKKQRQAEAMVLSEEAAANARTKSDDAASPPVMAPIIA
ncbi:hypothetical protein DYB32_005596 [Aphanomyces invadans]|uniref:PH domain-containing protein n=1 Tax=Aphanomyces invadans TaxID=157072 RepID=A0A418AU12_9STRA|nr:hypothetical protein DYB32_005596 [Aphanomyces invadans]